MHRNEMNTKMRSRGSIMLEKRRGVNILEGALSPALTLYDRCHEVAVLLVDYGVRTTDEIYPLCSYPPDTLKAIGLTDPDIMDILAYFAPDVYERCLAAMRKERHSVRSLGDADCDDDISVLTDSTYGTKRSTIIRKLSSGFMSYCDFSVAGDEANVSLTLADEDDRSYLDFMVNNPAEHQLHVRSSSFAEYPVIPSSPDSDSVESTSMCGEYQDVFLLSAIGVEDYANVAIYPDVEPFHVVDRQSSSSKNYMFCRQPQDFMHHRNHLAQNSPCGPHHVNSQIGRFGGRGTSDCDNSAFVFIKPHANTSNACRDLVRNLLTARKIRVVEEGEISAERINSERLIDQHYYAIGSKAVLQKPSQLDVPADKFEAVFHISWTTVLQRNLAYNAMDACAHLGLDAVGLDKAWGAAKDAGKMVKLGGGFYCGLIDTIPDKGAVYVINGFYMAMRAKFVSPGSSVHFFSVEWSSASLSFADFRNNVLGSTDPAQSPPESIRGCIFSKWERLGLSSVPTIGDNGVHASASPFEGLAERLNWLGRAVTADSFGRKLLQVGIPKSTIMTWCNDPFVGGCSVFDTLEESNSDDCLVKALMIQDMMQREN